MGWGKFLGCLAGGIIAVVTAPITLPALAVAGATVAAAAATVGAAAASTAIGAAVVGAATTTGAAVTAVAGSVAVAAGSTAIGAAVVGAATTAGSAVTAVAGSVAVAAGSTAIGSTIIGATAIATEAALAVGVTTTGMAVAGIGSGLTYSAITTAKGFENLDQAKSLISSAKQDYESESSKLNKKIIDTTNKLEKLNEQKLTIYSNEVKESIAIFEKITTTKESSTDYYDQESIENLFGREELKEIGRAVEGAVTICNDLKNGISLVLASSSATMSLVSNFGFASTGTAISSLSGAAAQRAALASLGGGALSTGGSGMMAGRLVLGGISLVPTAMIMSWKFANNSETQLTNAHDYYSQTQKEIENIKTQYSVLDNGIDKRIAEIDSTLANVATIYKRKLLPRLQKTYLDKKNSGGTLSFQRCSKSEKNSIELAVHFIRQLTKIMRVKVLDKNGMPNSYAGRIVKEINVDSQINEVA